MRIVKAGTGVIILGKQGENNATQVQFTVEDWIKALGTGTFQLLHQRSTDTQPHAVTVTYADGIVSWDVANTEVAVVGYGECELQFYQGTTLAKSQTWVTQSIASMSDAGSTPPEPWQSWVEEVLEAGTTAAESATSASQSATAATTAAATATTAASTAQSAATSASQSATAAESAKESIEESAEQIETNKEDIEILKAKKTQDIHLYSDGNAIWMYGDTTETPLTYTQIKTLTENETNNVYLTNGYYSFHNKYRYDKTISGQGEDAIGFIGSTQLNGKVYSYRIIINENNEVSADEIEVANESDLTTHTSNTTIHVTAADKTTWSGKQDAIRDLDTIRSGAEKGATAVQPGDLDPYAKKADLPTKTSDLTNDSGFITKAVTDLTNYYLKAEVNQMVSAIPKFSILPVDKLPENPSTTTIYLLKSGEESQNLYTEYIYVNGAWEKLGTQTVDLTGYAKESWVTTQIQDFLTETEINTLITTALQSYYTKTEVDTALAAKQDSTDNNLETTAKTVVGAVNELNQGLGNLDNSKVYADLNTFTAPGVFRISASTKNMISGYWYGVLHNLQQSDNKNAVQVVYAMYSPDDDTVADIYYREVTNGTTFQKWVKVAKSTDVEKKQDTLTDADKQAIANLHIPVISADDDCTIAYDDTKGVAPYNTSYGYTNITINTLTADKIAEGFAFFIHMGTDTERYVTSTYRNVRIRFGESGDWLPLFLTTAIAAGSTYLSAGASRLIYYSTDRYASGAFHVATDNNTTYSAYSWGMGYAVCSTAADTKAKTASISSYVLINGGICAIRFTYAVPASATLNITSKGAKPIYYKGAAITDGVINAGDIATFVYNGSQYVLLSVDRSADAADTVQTNLTAHIDNKNNPHEVTKAQVGLDKVDNVKQYSAENVPPYPVTDVQVDGASVLSGTVANIVLERATDTQIDELFE